MRALLSAEWLQHMRALLSGMGSLYVSIPVGGLWGMRAVLVVGMGTIPFFLSDVRGDHSLACTHSLTIPSSKW